MRRWAAAVLGFALVGCTVSRRFDGATQAALGKSDMRVLETKIMRLYYPSHRKGEALRVAARVEGCVERIRSMVQVHGTLADRPIDLVLPEAPLNNAYVIPPIAGEPVAVVPTHNTSDVFALFGLPPDPSFIACHEIVHWLHGTQISGFPAFLDWVFGDAYTPQAGLDLWFWEGLAVYYETRLQGGGRLGSRYWDGIVAAGLAGRGIHGGDLSEHHRQSPYGSHYLLGSYFVDWLAKTYGETALWHVVKSQSNAILFPFGVNLRFNGVYDKTLSTLIEEFGAHLETRWPARNKPSGQITVRELGTDARYERGPDGSEAIVDASWDRPTRLRVFGRDGALRFERNLVDVLPPRKLIAASPLTVSGLSFSREGRFLYFVALDQGEVQLVSRLLRVDLEAGTVKQLVEDVRGAGGSLDPDGRSYWFSRADGDRYTLAKIDLETHVVRVLEGLPPRTYVLDPQVSPDGARVAATVHDGREFRVQLFDAKTLAPIATVPGPDGARTEARWIDSRRLSFVAPFDGRFQVFVADLPNDAYERVTDAPYLAYRPRPFGDRVRFLDRAGWRWNVDEVALPKPAAPKPKDDGEPKPPSIDYPPPPDTLSAAPKSFAETVSSPPVERPFTIVDDAEYSHLDNLWRPQVRGPSIGGGTNVAPSVGAAAIFSDKLGFHRFGLEGRVDWRNQLYSGSFAFLESILAPWYVGASGSHVAQRASFVDGEGKEIGFVVSRETSIAIDVLRELFGNALHWRLAALGLHRRFSDRPDPLYLRFVGPTFEARWAAVEATPYTGARRALVAFASASYYPAGANASGFTLLDARGTLLGVVPLPLSSRHTFRLAARTRWLQGAPFDLLQIGGTGGMLGRSATLERPEADPREVLPPGFELAEPLRGFEDVGFYARGVGVLEGTYRYPIIVDWGSASTLWVLPSFFFRQLDFELFGLGATLYDRRPLLASAGASLAARFVFFRVPLSLKGQIARRFSLDERFTAFGFLGVDL